MKRGLNSCGMVGNLKGYGSLWSKTFSTSVEIYHRHIYTELTDSWGREDYVSKVLCNCDNLTDREGSRYLGGRAGPSRALCCHLKQEGVAETWSVDNGERLIAI